MRQKLKAIRLEIPRKRLEESREVESTASLTLRVSPKADSLYRSKMPKEVSFGRWDENVMLAAIWAFFDVDRSFAHIKFIANGQMLD
jgi:hypothetical protein